MLRIIYQKEYTSRKILSGIYFTEYISIADIPVVDTEGYWSWNSEMEKAFVR